MLDQLIFSLIQKRNKGELNEEISNILIYQKKVIGTIAKILISSDKLKTHKDYLKDNKIKNKRIALIGNSPIIETQNYGHDIDSHDLIVRMNTGIIPSKLSKEKSGVKTDLWATGALSAITHLDVVREVKRNREKYRDVLMSIPKRENDNEMFFYYFYYLYFKLRGHNLYFSEPEKYEELEKLVSEGSYKKYIPSTGFVFFMLLQELTKLNQLSLYGFTFSNEHRIMIEAPDLYHNFRREREIVMGIVEKNENIKIY